MERRDAEPEWMMPGEDSRAAGSSTPHRSAGGEKKFDSSRPKAEATNCSASASTSHEPQGRTCGRREQLHQAQRRRTVRPGSPPTRAWG
jgi:hypothetical protein